VPELNSDGPKLNFGFSDLNSGIPEFNSGIQNLNFGFPKSGFSIPDPRFCPKKRLSDPFCRDYTVLTQPKHARWVSHNVVPTRKVKHSMRIKVPANPDELITLAKAIGTKHTNLGASSPLNSIQDIAKLAAQTAIADTNNAAAKTLAKQAETATQARDVALGQSGQLTPGTVRFLVTSARDILAGANKGNEKKLGDWGFNVDDSPAPAKTKKTNPPA
jgi:hypothetical protein